MSGNKPKRGRTAKELSVLRKWHLFKNKRPSQQAVREAYQTIAQTPIPFDLQDLQRWRLHRGYFNLIFYPIFLIVFVFSYSHTTLASKPTLEAGIDVLVLITTVFFMMRYRAQLHTELTHKSLVPAVVAQVTKDFQGQHMRYTVTLFFQHNGKDVTLNVYGPPPSHLKELDHIVVALEQVPSGLKASGYVRIASINSLRTPYVTCHQAKELKLPFKKARPASPHAGSSAPT